jgi:hypothetical protein
MNKHEYFYKVLDLDNKLIMSASSMPQICQQMKVSHTLVSRRLKKRITKINVVRKDEKYHFNIERMNYSDIVKT